MNSKNSKFKSVLLHFFKSLMEIDSIKSINCVISEATICAGGFFLQQSSFQSFSHHITPLFQTHTDCKCLKHKMWLNVSLTCRHVAAAPLQQQQTLKLNRILQSCDSDFKDFAPIWRLNSIMGIRKKCLNSYSAGGKNSSALCLVLVSFLSFCGCL